MTGRGGAELDILAPDLGRALLQAWPHAAARQLAGLLARATREPAPALDYERAVLALCGIADPGDGTGSPALAGLCAAQDIGLAQVPSGLVRADPVHLRADPTRLVLVAGTALAVTADEADALIGLLNDHFPDLALRRGEDAARWYATLPAVPAHAGASPDRLHGQPLAPDATTRRAQAGLARIATEVQMVLHDCPVNTARAARGQAPVNSLWFWGGGELPRPPVARLAALASDDWLARAVAAYAGTPVIVPGAAPATPLDATDGGRLAWVAAPGSSDSAPAHVLTVLTPALAALAAGRLRVVRVRTAGFELRYARWTRWCAWRRPSRFLADLRAGVEVNHR